ncbi:hypothetical protein KY334_00915 [Candidatus Woesearchaeota archaeon]|nr:hypothetical protein [Candidatus Woesearchaeota archaeon]
MFGFGKKKKDDLFGDDDFNDENLFGGEGKFPPAENAFDEHTPISQIPKPANLGSADDMGFQKDSFNQNSGFNNPSQVSQPMNNQNSFNSQELNSHKQEVILAKLDAIKASIDTLNQRMINLENKISQQERRW